MVHCFFNGILKKSQQYLSLFVIVFVASCPYCVSFIQQAFGSVLQRPGRFSPTIFLFFDEYFGFWKWFSSCCERVVTGYGQRWDVGQMC